MPTKYAKQYKSRRKTNSTLGLRPCFFYMDKKTHARIKRSVRPGQMTDFIRTALQLAVHPRFISKVKHAMPEAYRQKAV